MPAERAGYTVTMFVVDTSPSMAKRREVPLPSGQTLELSCLEWGLKFVKLKIQEMIFNGRKTDQCGIITFGSPNTENIVNEQQGEGYDNVEEYIAIEQPSATTIAKVNALQPSDISGDPIDGLIVALETQADYLIKKKTWTRKVVIITDGESPMELEDWQLTADKINEYGVSVTIVGVDFDDEEIGFVEKDKSHIKRENERFWNEFVGRLDNGIVGSCALAIQETSRPDTKITKSTLSSYTLTLGDTETRAHESLEIHIKTSKCTAVSRPKSFKKFAIPFVDDLIEDEDGETSNAVTRERNRKIKEARMQVDEDTDKEKRYIQIGMRTDYFYDPDPDNEDDDDAEDVKMEVDEPVLQSQTMSQSQSQSQALVVPPPQAVDQAPPKKKRRLERTEKEELIRGYKYGKDFVPAPEDGNFSALPTKRGMQIFGFFRAVNFRREYSMGEVQYVWGDPSSPQQQVALSSMVRAMLAEKVMAIAKWVKIDQKPATMGVLLPRSEDDLDFFLWAQMPFADDVRKYTFPSLETLVTKNGEVLTEHAYLPTSQQQKAMDKFVDAMSLTRVGDVDEEEVDEGAEKGSWYNTVNSFNPAIHRIKQAMFHGAVTDNLDEDPCPPPHSETTKYFEPPEHVVEAAQKATVKMKEEFNVKEVPKKVAKAKGDGHQHAVDDSDQPLLLAPMKSPSKSQLQPSATAASIAQKADAADEGGDTEDEDEDMEAPVAGQSQAKRTTPDRPTTNNNPLPTPARSESPELEFDRGVAPGRIIGNTFPLKDFKDNLKRGDVVTKAVGDMGTVITEVVSGSFASKRHAEMLECMKVMRDVCLKEDEVDAWNTFLRDLKETCTLEEPGNPEFFDEMKHVGRSLSLISSDEAKKYGGTSEVSELRAKKFLI